MSVLRRIGAILRPEIVLALVLGLLVGLHCGYWCYSTDLRAFVNKHGGRAMIVADPDLSIPPPPAGPFGGREILQINLWVK